MRLTSWITRLLQLGTIGVFAIASQGCNIYQSQGRKAFETNAPGRVQTNIGTASLPNSLPKKLDVTENCWNQPATEALWNSKTESPLIVQKLNENQITVCLGRPDETETTTR